MSNIVHLCIKNMVCPRCISSVRTIMEEIGLQVKDISLGEVNILVEKAVNFSLVESKLKEQGFELIQDREAQLVNQTKAFVMDYLSKIGTVREKLSDFLVAKMDLHYSYISKIFSKNEANTIENYFILLKIEKVKELLTYNELSLGEIAFKLGYSSPQALSTQFKNVIGMTVSNYKHLEEKNRNSLDSIL